jgi:hydrogenase maturation protease
MKAEGASIASEARGTEHSEPWAAKLRDVLLDARTPLHLIGAGNPLRRDDSVGLELISHLVARLGKNPRKNVLLHTPEVAPERLLSRIDCGKERVLIFDAVASGRQPGQVILATLDDSKFGYFATHNVPIKMIPGVAENPANVYVAGIEPESLEVGEGLTRTVSASARKVSAVVESALGGRKNGPS